MTGLKRRQVATLARAGEIPGVERPDGCHYQYARTSELLEWIAWKRQRVATSRRPLPLKISKKGHGFYSPYGIRRDFDIWLRKVKPQMACWNDEDLEVVRLELSAIARFYSRIVQMQKSRNASRTPLVSGLKASSPR